MADAARSQRHAALEAKKKRLEELKARRQQRAATNSVSAQDAARAKIAASSNLDDYIDGLLQVPGSSPNSARAATSEVATSSVSPTENGSAGVDGMTKNSESVSSSENKVADVSTPVQHSAIQIMKAETFEMGTQTADFSSTDDAGAEEDPEPPSQSEESQDPNLTDATKTNELMEEEGISSEAKVLSTEEVEKELSSEAFSSFLNITSKKVERVLGSDLLANLLVDYDGIDDKDKDSQKTSDGSKFLASRQMYECPKWTNSRDVTDMDWSPLHRELMLCGYHMPSSTSSLGQPVGSSAVKVLSPDDTPSDSLAPRNGELLSDGLALVWNLAMPNRPEHIFTCGSPVTTVRFHPTESTLIIGGCQSGQVVVWDIRAGRMPVQKSVLTTTVNGNSKGHTHPICAMEVIEGGVS
jgi:dynein intermediate chain